MGRTLCAWALGALILAHEVVCAVTGLNEGGYALAKRQTSPSPALSFSTLPEMHTCGSTTIDWTYTGPPINITLWVTNIGVPQTEFIPANQNLTLSTRINPASQHFSWNPVNVSAGHYQLVASIVSQEFSQRSPTFLVKEGDFACLTAAASTGTAGGAPIATEGSGSSSHTGASSDSNSSMGTGAIAGLVVGVLLFIILAAIGIFFFLRRRKREIITRRQQQDFARGYAGHSAHSSVRTVVGANYEQETDKYGGSHEEDSGEKIIAPRSERKESVASHASLATFSTLGSPSQHEDVTENGEEKALRRQSFGRKRKPAPIYDGTGEPPLPSSTLSSPASNPTLGLSPSPLSPPRSLAGEEVMTRPRSATLGHYALRTAVESRPSTADGADLLHKSSFGPTVEGKQLHYLMPDLPGGASPAR